MLQTLGKAKSLENHKKNENRAGPYKGATLGPYPEVPECLPHPHPLPSAAATGFHQISPGRQQIGLPEKGTGKLRLPAGLPVIWADFCRRRPGKHFKIAQIA
jgi:hypothetical protein